VEKIQNKYILGFSEIDINTGYTSIKDIHIRNDDEDYTTDELVKYI